MKDLSKQPKKIKDQHQKVKHLIRDINDVDAKTVSIFAQTPLREKLGMPPMEIRNTLEEGLKDLETISNIHKKQEEKLNGIS